MSEPKDIKLEILMQRIPVSHKQGEKLLEKVKGDLEEAEKNYVEESVAQVCTKTGVKSEIALKHLIDCNFDIRLTIESINENVYTSTERITRKYSAKKEKALDEIFLEVINKYNIKKKFWISPEDLKQLPTEIYGFIVIMEWLNFESWENYQSALLFNIQKFTEQIDLKLSLFEISNSLRKAEDVVVQVYDKLEVDDSNKYVEATNELMKNKEFVEAESKFREQRKLIIDKLYEFVQDNISKFP